jgi:hypothetical protein
MNTEPKIGDWVRPIDPIIHEINYGYNLRLIIEVIKGISFTTTCDAFGIEEGLWDLWNTEFAGRVILDKFYD